MRLGSFATGVLALAALEVVTSSPGAAQRTAALPTAAAGLARRLLDPNIALLPNWHDNQAPPHANDASTAGTTTPGHAIAPAPTSAAAGARSAATSTSGVVGPGI